MKRAGLAPWPRLFQNLRSTRATELADEFPGHVVSSWLGHSEDIAKEHYRQVTDDHFARATGYALPEMMPPDAVSGRTDSNSQTRPVPQPVSAQEETAACGSTQPLEMEDRGLEQVTLNAMADKELRHPKNPAHRSAAVNDAAFAQLASVVEVWPKLPQGIRDEVLMLVRHSMSANSD